MLKTLLIILGITLTSTAFLLWPSQHGSVEKGGRRIRMTAEEQTLANAVTHWLSGSRAEATAPRAEQADTSVEVQVRVLDRARRPVARALVRSESEFRGRVEGTTNSAGIAALRLEGGESVRISARAEDGSEGASSEYFWVYSETPTTIATARERNRLDIQVVELATLSGRVLDVRGEGVDGARLRLIPLRQMASLDPLDGALYIFNDGSRSGYADAAIAADEEDAALLLTTAGDGSFTLPIRGEGAWALAAIADGMRPMQTAPMQFVAGQHTEVDVRLLPGHSFRGRIVDEVGAGVAGATVTMQVDDQFFRNVASETGEFEFVGFEQTEATVSVEAHGFLTLQEQDIRADASNTRVALARGAILDVDLCVSDAAGADVNAWVQGPGGYSEEAAPLDASGCAVIGISALTPGRHVLTLQGAGFWHRASHVEVTPSRSRLRIRIGEHTAVSGRVVLPAASPSDLSAASVHVRGPAQHASVTTGADGRFRFSGDIADAQMITASVYVGSGNAFFSHEGPIGARRHDMILHPAQQPLVEESEEYVDEGAEEAPCQPRLDYTYAEGKLLLTTSDTLNYASVVLAGDVLVGANDAPLEDAQFWTGTCGTSIMLRLFRPATGERIAVSVERSEPIEEGGCGG